MLLQISRAQWWVSNSNRRMKWREGLVDLLSFNKNSYVKIEEGKHRSHRPNELKAQIAAQMPTADAVSRDEARHPRMPACTLQH